MTATLLEDAVSYVRKGRIYALKGEQVTIIKDNDTVLIVQRQTGERFPVSPKIISTHAEKSETKIIDPHRSNERDLSSGGIGKRGKGSRKAPGNSSGFRPEPPTLW
jgi:hypothetical protein